jgi:hypothetical protein
VSELGPDAVLAAGRRDAAGVLSLWLLRRSVWTVLWLTLIVVVVTGSVDSPEQLGEQLETAVTSVTDAQALVRSPATLLLFVAPAARLVSGWLAWAVAFPHASRLQREADRDLARGRLHPVSWLDRARLASALRTIRWTSSVRRRARARLGRTGTAVLVTDVVLVVTGIVLAPVAMVVLASQLAS